MCGTCVDIRFDLRAEAAKQERNLDRGMPVTAEEINRLKAALRAAKANHPYSYDPASGGAKFREAFA
jgi:hypothetical protein